MPDEVTTGAPSRDDEEFERLCSDLRYGKRSRQLAAAVCLRDFGALALPPLQRAIHDADPDVRSAVFQSLGRLHTSEAEDALIEALRDRDLEIRLAAAEALETVGTRRCVDPLLAGLRECFTGRSARAQLLTSFILLLAATAVAFTLIFVLRVSIASLIFPLFQLWKLCADFNNARQRSRVGRAVLTALAAVAERHPAPEIRQTLPDLSAMALDIVQQDRATRKASRSALHRIEAATAGIKDLPIASTGHALTETNLPVPADEPQQPLRRA